MIKKNWFYLLRISPILIKTMIIRYLILLTMAALIWKIKNWLLDSEVLDLRFSKQLEEKYLTVISIWPQSVSPFDVWVLFHFFRKFQIYQKYFPFILIMQLQSMIQCYEWRRSSQVPLPSCGRITALRSHWIQCLAKLMKQKVLTVPKSLLNKRLTIHQYPTCTSKAQTTVTSSMAGTNTLLKRG